MLVLDYPGIGRVAVRVIHHRHSLVVFPVQHLGLKTQAAVLQLAEPVAVKCVNGACVYHGLSQAVIVFPVFQVIRRSLYITALKQLLHYDIISPYGNPLIGVIEIIVVIDIPHRYAFDDKGRKLLAIPAPLLFRIPFYQFFVQFPSHQTDGLFLQVLWLTCNLRPLLLDDGLGLIRCGYAPHAAEGIHIKGHVVHLALIISHRAVGVAVELRQGIYEFPHLPVARMEDMGAVLVHMNALHVLAVHVSAYVVPLLHHQTALFVLSGVPGKHTCIQTASHQYIIVFFHIRICSFASRSLCFHNCTMFHRKCKWIMSPAVPVKPGTDRGAWMA